MIDGSGRRLAARLHLPSAPPHRGAVVCHPHPEYGGDMHNAVVVAVARALAAAGIAALRFDFGRPFGSGGPEVDDARAALDALAGRLPAGAPRQLVGYSFGAWVALRAAAAPVASVVAIGPPLAFLDWAFLETLAVPVRFVAGDRDQFCDVAQLAGIVAAHAHFALATLAGADHLLTAREADVATLAVRLLGGRGA